MESNQHLCLLMTTYAPYRQSAAMPEMECINGELWEQENPPKVTRWVIGPGETPEGS